MAPFPRWLRALGCGALAGSLSSRASRRNARLRPHRSIAGTRIVPCEQRILLSGIAVAPVANLVGPPVEGLVNLGTLSASSPSRSVTGTVDAADPIDDFDFTLAAATPIQLNLSGMTANLTLTLLRSDGTVVGSSSAAGTAIENLLTANLPAGGYRARITRATGVTSSSYRLDLSQNVNSDDLFSAAFDLGTITSAAPTVRSPGSVAAGTDIQDFVKFTLTGDSPIHVNLIGMTGDANVEILNSAGVVVSSGNAGGTAIENVLTPTLTAGTYYARILPTAGVTTNYEVLISRSVNSDDLFSAAFDLGTITSAAPTVRSPGSVATGTDIQDFVKFTLTNDSPVRVNLIGMTGDANVQILNSSGVQVSSGNQSGTTPENVQTPGLTAGTYYVRVRPATGVTTSYELIISRSVNSDDLFSAAFDLGTITSAAPTVRSPGSVAAGTDIQDFVKFTLTDDSPVRVNLIGMTGDANVQILNSFGVQVSSGNQSGTTPENVQTPGLTAGTYYVRVRPASGVTTSYDLTISRGINTDDLFTNATDLGVLGAMKQSVYVTQSIGEGDRVDVQRLTLESAGDLRLSLSGLSANASVQLLDNLGRVLDSSNAAGNGIESILETGLAAGTYYMRVLAEASGSTSYDLGITIQNSGNSLIAFLPELNLDDPNNPAWLISDGPVNSVSPRDYYRVTVGPTGTLAAVLSQLTENLDLDLLDSFGRLVNTSDETGLTPEYFNQPGLTPGVYFLLVRQVSNEFSNYELALSGDPNRDDLLINATNLGTLSSSSPTAFRTGNVANGTDLRDLYRFNLTATSDVRVNLSGLSQDANLRVLDGNGNLLSAGSQPGTTIENRLLTALPAGLYYVSVERGGTATTNYDLTVSTATTSDNLLSNAVDLGIVSSTTPVQQRVDSVLGNIDRIDHFRFRFATAASGRINLSGLAGNVDVALLDQNGVVLATGTAAGNSIELISQAVFQANVDYYIRVQSVGTPTTSYLLQVGISTAGNSLITLATDAGGFNSSNYRAYVASGTVNPNNKQDFYRFEVTGSSPTFVQVQLYDLAVDLDLELLDQFGRQLALLSNGGNNFESEVFQNLAVGTYYLRVFPQGNVTSSYKLVVGNTFLGNQDTFETSALISSTQFGSTFSILSSSNPHDFYRITLSEPTAFRLALSALTANANLELYNSTGQLLQQSNLTGTSIENITTPVLAAGTYYIRVAGTGVTTDYRLEAVTPTSSDNIISNATPLAVGTQVNGQVSSITDSRDYYRFTVPPGQSRRVTVTLGGQPFVAPIRIFRLDATGRGTTFVDLTTAGAFATMDFGPGTWHVLIAPNTLTTTPANYSIRLDVL